MHLNERLEKSREALGLQLAAGQQRVSSAYNRLWADMEAMREAQRKRQEEQRLAAEKEGRPYDPQAGKCESSSFNPSCPSAQSERRENMQTHLTPPPGKSQAPDLSHAQANISAASTRAGAYFSSWGSWASEKRKGWGTPKTPVSSPPPVDVKRADDFKRDKSATVGDYRVGSLDAGDVKRESFFDAEKDKA